MLVWFSNLLFYNCSLVQYSISLYSPAAVLQMLKYYSHANVMWLVKCGGTHTCLARIQFQSMYVVIKSKIRERSTRTLEIKRMLLRNQFDRCKMQIRHTLRRWRFFQYTHALTLAVSVCALYLYALDLKKQERYLKISFCMLANRACHCAYGRELILMK